MADGKKIIERKFLLEKKNIKLEDMKLFIEEYHPNEKVWFYNLCVKPAPVMKDGKETDEKALRSFLSIKSEFYKKFFPQEDALTQRMKLFSDWDIPDEDAKQE